MIITFHGTEKAKNSSPQILAACAFENAYVFSRKTLILQFYSKHPIEDILIGKQKGMEKIEFMEDDDETGIETLLRKTRSEGLMPEHFDIYTKPVITGAGRKNSLDIATIPMLADFQKEIVDRQEDVAKLLEIGKEVYDDIMILADGKDSRLVELLTNVSDKKIVCIPQGNAQTIFCKSEKDIYVVPEFDSNSLYNEKKLKKLNSIKQLKKIPYCVNYKDACMMHNALRFLFENNSKKDEITGEFITSIESLMESITTDSKEAGTETVQFDLKHVLPIPFMADKMEIEPEQVQIEMKKKHFWSRKKTVVEIHDEVPETMSDVGNDEQKKKQEVSKPENGEKNRKKKGLWNHKTKKNDQEENITVNINENDPEEETKETITPGEEFVPIIPEELQITEEPEKEPESENKTADTTKEENNNTTTKTVKSRTKSSTGTKKKTTVKAETPDKDNAQDIEAVEKPKRKAAVKKVVKTDSEEKPKKTVKRQVAPDNAEKEIPEENKETTPKKTTVRKKAAASKGKTTTSAKAE